MGTRLTLPRLAVAAAILASPAVLAQDNTTSRPPESFPPGPQGEAGRYWPQWRGPLGTGLAPMSDAPVRFSPNDGVKWKTPIPGRGHSTPIIWRDRVFVTTAVATEEQPRPDRPRRRRTRLVPHEFRLIAVDRDSGEVAWSSVAVTTRPHEGYHRSLSSFANASPVTDGERVYAFFGSRGLHAFDMSGELAWSRDFGVEMETYGPFGEASSPALYGDTIVVVFDHEGQSFVEAVDKNNGETRWKRLRDEETSWASPIVAVHEGRPQVVTSAGNFITAYDLTSGDLLWQARGMTPHPVPTPVFGHGLLIAASGTTERRIRAIRLGYTGDLTGSEAIAWAHDRAAPYNPSPLLWGSELYVVRDGAMNAGPSRLSLFDARTGRSHYLQERLPGNYAVKASPVGAGDKVFLATEQGDVIVIRRGHDFEVLAVNRMDERFLASPAIAGDELYLRGSDHLFCISERPASR